MPLQAVGMKLFLRFLALMAMLSLCGGAWLWYEARAFLNTPPAPQGNDVYVDIPAGAHLGQIARELQAKGVITDAKKFMWLARYERKTASLQAGRFRFNTAWLPRQVLDTLASGQAAFYRITIPEGLTWWQTARLLAEAGLARYDDLATILNDPAFLRHHGIPFASAEGFLMPDTYYMPAPPASAAGSAVQGSQTNADNAAAWRAQARNVASRMIDNFWRKGTPLWAPQTAPGAISRPPAENLKKWVILASIVEKETGVPAERARVAGVYENRLRKNMLLQADPTVIYGLGPDFDGRLRRAHLNDAANAYNTYQRAGLPPGPIASFGAAALKAAINPEQHSYLFFVATGEGDTHAFTTNLQDHNEAVRQYRRKMGRQ